MFGLVRPCYQKMQKIDKSSHRCYYCGLCVGMGRNTGLLSRVLVNYDVCLLYLVADSVSSDTEIKTGRCPLPPFKRIRYRDNAALLDKMAGINYILTYYKVRDDMADDRSIRAAIVERMLRKRFEALRPTEKDAVRAVEEGMKHLWEMEAADQYISVARSAEPFGDLVANAMAGCMEDPTDDKAFQTLCRYLGMWIYVIDACVDLKKDIRRHKYNPLKAGCGEASAAEIIAKRKEEITVFLMSCKQSIRQLLTLLSFAKNESLIQSYFQYMLPRDVADMLK